MKPLTAGSEIDALCTRCKMLLGHRIVALVRGNPARVICMTCDSEHRYLKAMPGARAVTPVKRLADGSISQVARLGSSSPARKTSPSSIKAPPKTNEWESRVLGKPLSSFTRYSMGHRFIIGELVSHPKFGDGYVVEVVDPQKVSILFRDGPRTLAQGQTS